jgi:hypothetical protein
MRDDADEKPCGVCRRNGCDGRHAVNGVALTLGTVVQPLTVAAGCTKNDPCLCRTDFLHQMYSHP